jgi:hypothetical protein
MVINAQDIMPDLGGGLRLGLTSEDGSPRYDLLVGFRVPLAIERVNTLR